MKITYTDADEKRILSALSIIADTREQQNGHILSYLDKKSVPVVTRKLDSGDYSFSLTHNGRAIDFDNEIVIERKGSLDEIAGNLTADRERFEREFIRLSLAKTKVYLMIEAGGWREIYDHNYISKMKPTSFVASLLEWQVRYNITVSFVPKAYAPEYIYGTLYYHAKQRLKEGIIL